MPSEPVQEFRTHRKYVRAFAVMCGHIYGQSQEEVWEDIIATATALPSFRNPQTGTAPDQDRLRRALTNAWGTEYLLQATYTYARDDDLVRIANSWAVVQAYYVAYHAIQALLASNGLPAPSAHTTAQNLFCDTWTGRRESIVPCSFGVGRDGPVNVPAGLNVDSQIHPWTQCDENTCWSLASLALRTTRDDAVDERKRSHRERKQREARSAWRAEEQDRLARGRRPRKEPRFPLPRLTAAEQARIERSVRIFTIMDYMYRLRVKANYIDAAMFTDGPEDEYTSRRLLQDLQDLASNILLVHEVFMISRLGSKAFRQLAKVWLAGRTGDPVFGLAERLDLLSAI